MVGQLWGCSAIDVQHRKHPVSHSGCMDGFASGKQNAWPALPKLTYSYELAGVACDCKLQGLPDCLHLLRVTELHGAVVLDWSALVLGVLCSLVTAPTCVIAY